MLSVSNHEGGSMVHLGLAWIVGGAVGAAWRHYRKRQEPSPQAFCLPVPDDNVSSKTVTAVFDDVAEVSHYHQVAWYTFALSTAGTLFLSPVRLLSLPLLGYNAYHLARTVVNSEKHNQKSPLVLFEVLGVAGSLATGSAIAASALLVFSFGSRKLFLYAGNVANNLAGPRPLNPRQASVWVLRDGAEVEVFLADLQADDVVVLQAGESIALTGKVLEGQGYVRQFSLQKQMKSVPKQAGDYVYAFTQLESGTLHIKAA